MRLLEGLGNIALTGKITSEAGFVPDQKLIPVLLLAVTQFLHFLCR